MDYIQRAAALHTSEWPERAAARFPAIDVLRNEKNLGFGATCNRGIQRALEHDVADGARSEQPNAAG